MMNHIEIMDLPLATVVGMTLEITLLVLFVIVVQCVLVWCWHHTTISDIVLILVICTIIYKNRS